MSQPLKIGISACFFHPDVNRRTFGRKKLIYSESDMMDWVMAHGHIPILIPPEHGPISESKWVDFVDGLILMGGDDLSPQSYGEQPMKPEWAGDPARDKYEISLYHAFRKAKKPVLGVCRGNQLINVAHGGNLYQDIATQIDGALTHRDAHIYDELFHDINIASDSFLNQIYSVVSAKTNSVHHQALKDLGKDLVVEARSSEDQIVEAVRTSQSKSGDAQSEWVLGVQWHPEFMQKLDSSYLSHSKLFLAFVEEVRLRR